jgi:hypothetical protein
MTEQHIEKPTVIYITAEIYPDIPTKLISMTINMGSKTHTTYCYWLSIDERISKHLETVIRFWKHVWKSEVIFKGRIVSDIEHEIEMNELLQIFTKESIPVVCDLYKSGIEENIWN